MFHYVHRLHFSKGLLDARDVGLISTPTKSTSNVCFINLIGLFLRYPNVNQ